MRLQDQLRQKVEATGALVRCGAGEGAILGSLSELQAGEMHIVTLVLS